MERNTKPLPGTQAPELQVDTLNGDTFDLLAQRPEHFTLLVFYRGYHCPICKTYLEALNAKLADFARLGVQALALSMDPREQAERSAREWSIQELNLGYGLSEEQARTWGLYISEPIKDSEPERFSEPGLFLVRNDGKLHYAAINSMPFGRPRFEDVESAVEFILDKQYPARGEAA